MGRLDGEKDQFYNKMTGELNLRNPGKRILGLGYFKKHLERRSDSLRMCMVEIDLAKEMLRGRRLLEFFDEKELSVASTWIEKKEQRK